MTPVIKRELAPGVYVWHPAPQTPGLEQPARILRDALTAAGYRRDAFTAAGADHAAAECAETMRQIKEALRILEGHEVSLSNKRQ